ncbi:MAG: hypothetical protein K6C34_04630 [Alphaproteobacteria bacterium]|nr:hypothetical protein [Alphaproteobacteria bacterium]
MESSCFTHFVEFVFACGLFINALLFIPQAREIYVAKNAQGQSLLAFSGFNMIQLFTVLHAYIHDDYILLIGSALSFITCGTVTILIIFYQFKAKRQ